MTLSGAPQDSDTPGQDAISHVDPEASSSPNDSMEEFFRLQQNLLICAVAFTAVIFVSTWIFYSLHIALNYLIGACTGVVYLRMLGKNVAEIGRGRKKIGSSRLALFIGLIVLATQWNQLEVMPVFLGFLTYKAALIAYTIWTAVLPEKFSEEQSLN